MNGFSLDGNQYRSEWSLLPLIDVDDDEDDEGKVRDIYKKDNDNIEYFDRDWFDDNISWQMIAP
jgi:hypothetical protein